MLFRSSLQFPWPGPLPHHRILGNPFSWAGLPSSGSSPAARSSVPFAVPLAWYFRNVSCPHACNLPWTQCLGQLRGSCRSLASPQTACPRVDPRAFALDGLLPSARVKVFFGFKKRVITKLVEAPCQTSSIQFPCLPPLGEKQPSKWHHSLHNLPQLDLSEHYVSENIHVDRCNSNPSIFMTVL